MIFDASSIISSGRRLICKHSYVQLAIMNKEVLVTEDRRLREKLRELVEVKSVSKISYR